MNHNRFRRSKRSASHRDEVYDLQVPVETSIAVGLWAIGLSLEQVRLIFGTQEFSDCNINMVFEVLQGIYDDETTARILALACYQEELERNPPDNQSLEALRARVSEFVDKKERLVAIRKPPE